MFGNALVAALVSVLLKGMMATIKLQNQFRLETSEIGDVRPNRVLTAELETTELSPSQLRPED